MVLLEVSLPILAVAFVFLRVFCSTRDITDQKSNKKDYNECNDYCNAENPSLFFLFLISELHIVTVHRDKNHNVKFVQTGFCSPQFLKV